MGEYADAMLDGTMCEDCGEYLGGQQYGVALLCARCAEDRRHKGHEVARVGRFFQDLGEMHTPSKTKALKVKCPSCPRMVKAVGLADHVRVMHAAG